MKKASNPQFQDQGDDPSTTQPDQIVDNQESRVAELTADLQRIQAEFINYKARVETEKLSLSQFAKTQVVKDFLPVIDDLERALSHLPEDLKDNKWAQGTAKVYDRLQKQLDKLGVTRIDALNQHFNPAFHEAVQAEGDGEEQIISDVLQQGYTLGDQVIRHSIVKVVNK